MKVITNSAYMSARPVRIPYPTDNYYVPLANNIFKMLQRDYHGKHILDVEVLGQIARKVTWYFEDIVADMGIWRSFSEQCQRLYGYPVPIFHSEEEYFADEPSINAVSYIVWDVVSELHSDISVYPNTGKLSDIAYDIYNILYDEFENAPVNDDAKADIKDVITHSCKGFNELRESLNWILTGNYITRNFNYHADEAETERQLDRKLLADFSKSMRSYYVRTTNYFGYKTGPLAQVSYLWLADLARVYGMKKEQKLLEGIEVLSAEPYQYKAKDDTWLHMESAHGKQFDIRKKELNLPDEALKKNDGCIAQFIFFKGEWHLNGVLVSHNFGDKFETIKKHVNLKPNEKVLGTDRILKATGGRHMLFYKDTKEMLDDLKKKKIMGQDQTFPFVNDPECKRPCFFVNESDKNNNMFFGFNFEEYIKDPSNPYYDEKEAQEDAVTMLWEAAAPPEFVDWLIDNDKLPDIAGSKLFLQDSSKEDIKSDMHFMVRYTRRNKM